MQKEISGIDIKVGKEIVESKKLDRSIATLKILGLGVSVGVIVKTIEIVSPMFDNLVVGSFSVLKSMLLNGTALMGIFIPNWFAVILIIGIIAAALPKEDKR